MKSQLPGDLLSDGRPGTTGTWPGDGMCGGPWTGLSVGLSVSSSGRFSRRSLVFKSNKKKKKKKERKKERKRKT